MTKENFQELVKLKQREIKSLTQEIEAQSKIIKRLEEMLASQEDDDLLS